MAKLTFNAFAAENVYAFDEYDAAAFANDFVHDDNLGEKETTAKIDAPVSAGGYTYFTVTKCNIGFREATQLVKIAAETGSTIKLVAGSKVGTTASVLSLIKMVIPAGASVGICIACNKGKGDVFAKYIFSECRRVFLGQ